MTTPANLARRFAAAATTAAAAFGLLASPLSAQLETVDPDEALQYPIDGDLEEAPGGQSVYAEPQPAAPATTYSPAPESAPDPAIAVEPTVAPTWSDPTQPGAAVDNTYAGNNYDGSSAASDTAIPPVVANAEQTYREDDLIGAAQGVFGDGAKEVATLIRRLLADQGEPNAYIVGREASGAFIVGARYGSGTLYHKVEGERPVYWTGPSIGFDAGANAGSTFVLVYNLYDSEELYERYPAGEGQLYAVGGLTASYMRKGDVVLIPIRVGAGLRLGINAGYMKFSKEQRWLPF
ncbi:MAG: DUF1134 domain-containing protein [Alphaproteobacteria bacterium]|nr:DUF1134 domain-containing protein [Alphaproteobacteria bacterium]MBU1756709.1 DUF1134 domain-containing protein [Alphaproteobacteria bacterium]